MIIGRNDTDYSTKHLHILLYVYYNPFTLHVYKAEWFILVEIVILST